MWLYAIIVFFTASSFYCVKVVIVQRLEEVWFPYDKPEVVGQMLISQTDCLKEAI